MLPQILPQALADALDAAECLPAPDAAALLRPWITDAGWLKAAVADQIAQMAAHPLHLPPAQASRAGRQRHLVLARTQRVSLAVTMLETSGRAISEDAPVPFSGQIVLTHVLPRTPLNGTLFVLDAQGQARRARDIAVPPGGYLELDEQTQAVRIHPGGAAPLTLLRATILQDGSPLSRSHDPHTGACIAQASRDEEGARTLMLLSLLRTCERRDAAPCFDAATMAVHPHQRWAAMREYLALDTAAALPRLRALASDDPDAQVRRLAQATLSQIMPQREPAPCPA